MPAASTTAVEAHALGRSSRAAASVKAGRRSRTRGTSSSVRIRSRTCTSSLRPSAPPGMRPREVVLPRSRAHRAAPPPAHHPAPSAPSCSQSAPGSAGRPPARRWTVQHHVGVLGQRRIEALPVIAISGTCARLSTGRMTFSSSLSPELEMAITTSLARHHAQIAVAGLGRVHEHRRRAGRRQRGRDLAARHGRSCPCPSRRRGRGWRGWCVTACVKLADSRDFTPSKRLRLDVERALRPGRGRARRRRRQRRFEASSSRVLLTSGF